MLVVKTTANKTSQSSCKGRPRWVAKDVLYVLHRIVFKSSTQLEMTGIRCALFGVIISYNFKQTFYLSFYIFYSLLIVIIIDSWFSAPRITITMTHCTGLFNSTVSSLKNWRTFVEVEERFQGMLEDRRGMHHLKSSVGRRFHARDAATENALSPNFRRVLGTT